MNERLICRSMAIAFLFLIVTIVTAGQKPIKIQTLSSVEKDEVYDCLFQRSVTSFDTREHEFALDIRLLPSFSAAKQVSVIRNLDGKVLVKLVTTKNQDISLGDQVLSVLESSSNRNPESICEAIETIEVDVIAGPNLKKMVDELPGNLGFKRQTNTFVLDGTKYSIWYRDAGMKLRVDAIVGDSSSVENPPFITWANKVIELAESAGARPIVRRSSGTP